MAEPTLVVGNGLIGSALAGRLRAAGRPAVTVARTGSDADCDLSDPTRLRRVLDRVRPGRVVLTHGPSDVTWIEGDEAAARRVHAGVAAVVADSGVPATLVSTDNVFPGVEGARRPDHPVAPGNAYGRVKLEAERALLRTGRSLVLRVSLVYGWTGGRHRATYGQRCLESALLGRPLAAPTDQWFTPVHADDVGEVLVALCLAPGAGTRHLSGPRELSRWEFARAAYRLAGADPALVRPCLRRDTEWASRPRHSSLRCDRFDDVPGLRGWQPLSPEEGLARMLGSRLGLGRTA